MRIVKKSFELYKTHYKLVKELEQEDDLISKIEAGLSSIFLISQNLPKKDTTDFFSHEDFPLSECFEELETSYELMKLGFYKQSMISLRTALDVGLLSIYWTIVGKESKIFIDWLNSRLNTPFKNDKFWKTIISDNYICLFDNKYKLVEEIKSITLSNYVHTKGFKYSNYSTTQRAMFGNIEKKEFDRWFNQFIKIIRIIEILHLLRFPVTVNSTTR